MDIELFTTKLTESICNELHFWNYRLSVEMMRGFCLSVIPYEGFLGISFLTTIEDFDEAKDGKWDSVAGWRWYNFTENWNTNWLQVEALGLTEWMVEHVETTGNKEEFVQAGIKAIRSEQVRAKLNLFNLADDFELCVYQGDGGGGSYETVIPWK